MSNKLGLLFCLCAAVNGEYFEWFTTYILEDSASRSSLILNCPHSCFRSGFKEVVLVWMSLLSQSKDSEEKVFSLNVLAQLKCQPNLAYVHPIGIPT